MLKNGRYAGSLIFILLILAWEVSYRLIGWKSWIFPAPSHILDATLAMLNFTTNFGKPLGPNWPFPTEGQTSASDFWFSPLVIGQVVSMSRLIIGFVLSYLVGMCLGVITWRYYWVNQLLGPLFLGIQTLPSVCWVPLAIIFFGINEIGIMFVLFMGSFCAVSISLRDGLKVVPPIYRQAGMMMGARKWKLYRYVIFPASLPAFASSLRSGFTFAWRSLMGGELIFVVEKHGLGHLLATGREFSDVPQVMSILIIMITTGIVFDKFVFAKIEARVHARFGF